ncbi:MAG: TraR/DksA C4-type zinc finger protein [Phycisphaerales bacterium]|nr:MAG: TraR/DksA C4-type zinc finger protein [Phycisphaerales bacterium]
MTRQHKRMTGQRQHDRSALTNRLELLRRQLLSDIRHYRDCMRVGGTEPGDLDDSQELCQATAAGAVRHLLDDLRAIDRALERISSGEYGVCIDCGRSIPRARLEFLPTAVRCTDCQRVVDQSLPRAS